MASREKVRVRTGCITCKVRRVKCDETKPSCQRCDTSGRKCGGYADKRSYSPGPGHSHPDVDNFLSNALSPDEHRWLDRFSSRTGPALSVYPDSQSFWSLELPQLSLSEPAIRHALLAVSSCHARFESQLSSAEQPHEIVSKEFTIKHYSKAIASLKHELAQQSNKLQVPLICCLLFICLECLFGNTALTLGHLKNGLKILDLCLLNEGHSPTLKSLTTKLKPIYDKFTAQSIRFGTSVSFSTKPAGLMDFTDISGAQTKLNVMIRDCMNFVEHMRNNYGERRHPEEDDYKREQQKTRLDELLAWETQMGILEQGDPPRVDPNDASVIMLHIRHQSVFVYVAICLDPRQTFCDAFLHRFKAMVDLIERLMTSSNNIRASPAMLSFLSSAFSLESSMIPALWLTARRCRHPTIRRRAIVLLEMHPGREGLWDAKLHAKAAWRIVEIEEASLATQEEDSAHWPKEHVRVYRTDVHRIAEEPARSAKLVFYTAPNGYFGEKVVWSEEITF